MSDPDNRRALQEEFDKLPFGVRRDGKDVPDSEHKMVCRNCGRTFDMRDLGDVFYHESCTDAR